MIGYRGVLEPQFQRLGHHRQCLCLRITEAGDVDLEALGDETVVFTADHNGHTHSDVASSYTDRDTLRQVSDALDLLVSEGPTLGRPIVDRIKGSGLQHLKELRPGSAGTSGGARRVSIRTVDQGGGVVTEWHTWDEVSAELGDVLGSAEERAQRIEQLSPGAVAW